MKFPTLAAALAAFAFLCLPYQVTAQAVQLVTVTMQDTGGKLKIVTRPARLRLGPVTFQVVNTTSLPHRFQVARVDDDFINPDAVMYDEEHQVVIIDTVFLTEVGETIDVPAGTTVKLSMELKERGRHQLFSNLPGDFRAGLHEVVDVVGPQ